MILVLYEQASGQQVNLEKSSVFFAKGIAQERKEAITQELGIQEALAHDKYLGLPTYIRRSKKRAFIPIRDRIGKQLSGWMDKLVSWARREVLIKTVAQAIPTYAMSIFKLPKDICHCIQAVINKFWWNHGGDFKKIHWISSARLCRRKEDRGLGFKDLTAFNEALLAKQVWRLMHDNSSLIFEVLRARYLPSCDLLDARLGVKPSYTWRSLHGVYDVVRKGTRWVIGNAELVYVGLSKWLPQPSSF